MNLSEQMLNLSLEEYRALRSESQIRIAATFTQSSSAFTAMLTAWASAIALLALSFNNGITDYHVLVGFDIAQTFALFIPILLLVPLAIKSGENLCQITAIACYIRIFYENKNQENEKYMWESANHALNPVLQKLIGRPLGRFANSEYSILAVASILMLVGFSVIDYARINELCGYPKWLVYLHLAKIVASAFFILIIIQASSVKYNMRENVTRYLAGFVLFAKKERLYSNTDAGKKLKEIYENTRIVDEELDLFLKVHN